MCLQLTKTPKICGREKNITRPKQQRNASVSYNKRKLKQTFHYMLS